MIYISIIKPSACAYILRGIFDNQNINSADFKFRSGIAARLENDTTIISYSENQQAIRAFVEWLSYRMGVTEVHIQVTSKELNFTHINKLEVQSNKVVQQPKKPCKNRSDVFVETYDDSVFNGDAFGDAFPYPAIDALVGSNEWVEVTKVSPAITDESPSDKCYDVNTMERVPANTAGSYCPAPKYDYSTGDDSEVRNTNAGYSRVAEDSSPSDSYSSSSSDSYSSDSSSSSDW